MRYAARLHLFRQREYRKACAPGRQRPNGRPGWSSSVVSPGGGGGGGVGPQGAGQPMGGQFGGGTGGGGAMGGSGYGNQGGAGGGRFLGFLCLLYSRTVEIIFD